MSSFFMPNGAWKCFEEAENYIWVLLFVVRAIGQASNQGTFSGGPVVKNLLHSERGLGSISGTGTKIPHAMES